MGKVKELIANASRDFEEAKSRKSVSDYVTAIVLYNKAVEKVLRAFFITKVHKEPPADASIGYLAKKTGMPDEISMYIKTLQEKETTEPAEFMDIEQSGPEESVEMKAFYLEGLAKRLLDYVIAYNR